MSDKTELIGLVKKLKDDIRVLKSKHLGEIEKLEAKNKKSTAMYNAVAEGFFDLENLIDDIGPFSGISVEEDEDGKYFETSATIVYFSSVTDKRVELNKLFKESP